MNCQEWEQNIALWVEGDLPPSDKERVKEHLSSCAACRSFADELAETQAQMRLMRDEAADEVALRSIRARVIERLEGDDRAGVIGWLSSWSWSYTGAAALLALALGLWVLSSDTSDSGVTAPGPEAVARTPTPSEVMPLGPSRPEPEASVAVEEVGPPSQPPQAAGNSVQEGNADIVSEPPIEPVNEPETLVVKLLTDDPNVVIYWLVDQDGGQE